MTEIMLEILKYILPSLIVLATAYYLLNTLLTHLAGMKHAELNNEQKKTTLPLRLAAYERLTLLCDRADIPALIIRYREHQLTVGELQAILIIGINQEFDHNVTQQMYISETLWKIISLAKEETASLIMRSSAGLDKNAPCEQLVNELFNLVGGYGAATPFQKALAAIRTEVATIL